MASRSTGEGISEVKFMTVAEVAAAMRVSKMTVYRLVHNGERDRAFEAFYTTKPGGSGLGLTIVRRLVLDLGGRVRIDSPNGHGSTFVVELPGYHDGA